MKRYTVFALVLVLAASSAATAQTVALSRLKDEARHKIKIKSEVAYQRGRDRDAAIEEARISRTLRLGASGEVDVSNIAGDITVTGGGGNDVRMEAVKRARGNSASDARRQLELVEVTVNERPARVEIRTIYPRGERRINVSVDYTLSVPVGATVTLKSISGDLKVSNVRGDVTLDSVSGDAVIDAESRNVVLKSVSGDVQVLRAGDDADLRGQSVSGTLYAKGSSARSIDFGSVSGNVIVDRVNCDRLNIRSVSGNLEYRGALSKSGRYEMKTHSGDVRLQLAGDTGFEVVATSFSGNVRSDFPITLRGRQDDEGRSRSRHSRAIRGEYGDGSALVELTSFSGSIVISK